MPCYILQVKKVASRSYLCKVTQQINDKSQGKVGSGPVLTTVLCYIEENYAT